MKKPSFHQTHLVNSIGKNNSEAAKQLDQPIANFFWYVNCFLVVVVAQPNHTVSLHHDCYIQVNGFPLSTGEDPAFQKMCVRTRNTNNSYAAPSKDRVGGPLLLENLQAYKKAEKKKLLDDAEVFGLSLYGDGATIKTTILINIMGAEVNNPGCVLEVVDCSEHMSTAKDKEGGKKDALYICQEILSYTKRLDPKKELFHCLVFEGASNVTKAA
jgi:hypothetical protein